MQATEAIKTVVFALALATAVVFLALVMYAY